MIKLLFDKTKSLEAPAPETPLRDGCVLQPPPEVGLLYGERDWG